jgi:hypothetical protein
MSINLYLLPTFQITDAQGNVQNVPEYSTLAPAPNLYSSFSGVPYGSEGAILINLPSPIDFSAQNDVLSFPSDLTTLVSSADQANLDSFLGNLSIPSSWVTVGQTWQDVARQLLAICLVAQFLDGQSNASLFSGGATLSTSVAELTPPQSIKQLNPPPPSSLYTALQNAQNGQTGVFDLTQVQDTDSVEDTLVNLSQQFTAPIIVGVNESI